MENELIKIKDEALAKIEACSSLKELNDIRVHYLGKKGPIQEAMKAMKNMAIEERKTFGQTSNKVKQDLSKAVEDKKVQLENQAIIDQINSESIDLTLPGYSLNQGTMHPLSIIVAQLEDLFLGMGTWTFFQILAWVTICLLTDIFVGLWRVRKKEPPLIVMAVFAFLMGYVFGIIVSLEQLMLGGFSLYIVYYLAGLLFDTFHAVGNFVFYLLCAPLLMKLFQRELQKSLYH